MWLKAEIYRILKKVGQQKIDANIVNQLLQLEIRSTSENFKLIKLTAKHMGETLIMNPNVEIAESSEELIWQRYILLPLLYKLGYTREASVLAQRSFEKLFPRIHEIIKNKIIKIYSKNYYDHAQDILKQFYKNKNEIDNVETRIFKSTHSIWKKIRDFNCFIPSNTNIFLNRIYDLLAIRWHMKICKDENYFDSLLNGIRFIPKAGIRSYRNQYVPQRKGFSLEPVIIFYYILNNMPVECQIITSGIDFYLSAKGYADYKTNYNFPPLKSNLSKSQYLARLGLCIHYKKLKMKNEFHMLMLRELLNNFEIIYDPSYIVDFESIPRKESNRSLCFSEYPKIEIYKLKHYQFKAPLKLSNINQYSCMVD